MAKYKVINRFKDKQHNGHIYDVGEIYPAKDKKLMKKRAESLTKIHPKYKVAFLEEIEEKKQDKKSDDK